MRTKGLYSDQDHRRYSIAVGSPSLPSQQWLIANMMQRCLGVIGDTVSLKCQCSTTLDVSLIVRFASDGNCASAWLTCKRWINCHRSRYRWFNIDLLLYNLNQPQLIAIALHTAIAMWPMNPSLITSARDIANALRKTMILSAIPR